MTFTEFDQQMEYIRQYYLHGLVPRTKTWFKLVESMSAEQFHKVVTFYSLTHNEVPNSPYDLLESQRILELAEKVLSGGTQQ